MSLKSAENAKKRRATHGSLFFCFGLMSVGFLELTEISLQKACESSAVASLVLRHFMYGVVDSVEVVGLCHLRKIHLAGAGAVLGLYLHLEVLLGRGGNHLTQHLCKLCGVPCLNA